MPANQTVLTDWIIFGNDQTGQLDTSNEHYVQGIGIVKRCEERDKKVTAHLTRKWYEFWK